MGILLRENKVAIIPLRPAAFKSAAILCLPVGAGLPAKGRKAALIRLTDRHYGQGGHFLSAARWESKEKIGRKARNEDFLCRVRKILAITAE
jgi:hypothetical protein